MRYSGFGRQTAGDLYNYAIRRKSVSGTGAIACTRDQLRGMFEPQIFEIVAPDNLRLDS